MGGCGFGDGILGRRGFDGLGLFGGLDGGCGGCGGEKKIAVITAVRAVAAKGDGKIFERDWW